MSVAIAANVLPGVRPEYLAARREDDDSAVKFKAHHDVRIAGTDDGYLFVSGAGELPMGVAGRPVSCSPEYVWVS